MKRRDVLTAAPVAALTAALCAGDVAAATEAVLETPVAQAYREWKRTLDAWNADMERDGSDENGSRWCALTFGKADDILGIPSEGPMDFVYKLMAHTYLGQHEIGDGARGDDIWAEARALVGGGGMMDDEQFKFTPLRMNTPWDNLTAAIGLIQAQILAEETVLNPEVMFGHCHFKRSSLEAAVALLAAMTGETEELRWRD